MAQSCIHYKFKAAKENQAILFDGLGLSVADLKREILIQKKLKGGDFDLVLSNAETQEEYHDDDTMIPRNSSIWVRRVPVQRRPGQLTGAARYTGDVQKNASVASGGASGVASESNAATNGSPAVSGGYGRGSMGSSAANPFQGPGRTANSVTFGRNQKSTGLRHNQTGFANKSGTSSDDSSSTNQINHNVRPHDRSGPGGGRSEQPSRTTERTSTGDDEQDRIRAMFEQSSEHWEKEQERMAGMKRLMPQRPFPGGPGAGRGGAQRPPVDKNGNSLANRTPPPNYVCFRCGQKGHFIQVCPTNNDKTFDRPKVKRTTGIPKSFLREVENPLETLQDRAKGQGGSGVMVTKDGKVVQAMANDSEWNKFKSRAKNTFDISEELVKEAPAPPDMRCGICTFTMFECVEIRCCKTLFCNECIQKSLTEEGDNHLKCPNCKKHATLDSLRPEMDMRIAIETWVSDWAQRKQKEEKDKSPAGSPQTSKRKRMDDDEVHESGPKRRVGAGPGGPPPFPPMGMPPPGMGPPGYPPYGMDPNFHGWNGPPPPGMMPRPPLNMPPFGNPQGYYDPYYNPRPPIPGMR